MATTGARSQTSRIERVGLAAGLLRRARDVELHRAAHVICPSRFLAGLTAGWGVPAERVSVLPNPTPPLPQLPEWSPGERPTLAFAGRLTAPKDLGVALAAVAACDGVTLRLAGEGDERAALEARAAELGLDSRVEFLGALGRDEVLALFRAADAAILSSAWENFPHTVVEALAVGTPVIATAVGGVPEVVADGENGLLVPPGDSAALAAAIRRFFAEPELRERLRSAAAPSVERLRARAGLRRARADPRGGGPVTRLLIVGRTRYRLPSRPAWPGSSPPCAQCWSSA